MANSRLLPSYSESEDELLFDGYFFNPMVVVTSRRITAKSINKWASAVTGALKNFKSKYLDDDDWYASIGSYLGPSPAAWKSPLSLLVRECVAQVNCEPPATDSVVSLLASVAQEICNTRIPPGNDGATNSTATYRRYEMCICLILSALMDMQNLPEGHFMKSFRGKVLARWDESDANSPKKPWARSFRYKSRAVDDSEDQAFLIDPLVPTKRGVDVGLDGTEDRPSKSARLLEDAELEVLKRPVETLSERLDSLEAANRIKDREIDRLDSRLETLEIANRIKDREIEQLQVDFTRMLTEFNGAFESWKGHLHMLMKTEGERFERKAVIEAVRRAKKLLNATYEGRVTSEVALAVGLTQRTLRRRVQDLMNTLSTAKMEAAERELRNDAANQSAPLRQEMNEKFSTLSKKVERTLQAIGEELKKLGIEIGIEEIVEGEKGTEMEKLLADDANVEESANDGYSVEI